MLTWTGIHSCTFSCEFCVFKDPAAGDRELVNCQCLLFLNSLWIPKISFLRPFLLFRVLLSWLSHLSPASRAWRNPISALFLLTYLQQLFCELEVNNWHSWSGLKMLSQDGLAWLPRHVLGHFLTHILLHLLDYRAPCS